MPILDKIILNLIKTYYDISLKNIGVATRLKRFSTKKIFISNLFIKHTNNKVIISLYLHNREKIFLLKKLENILKNLENKYIKNISYLYNLKLQNFNISNKIEKEIKILYKNKSFICCYKQYYENLLKKILKIEILYIYYRNILLFNNLKFKELFLNRMKRLIYKVYKKKIEFNIINIKQIYLNTDIFMESIAIKLKNRKNKLLKVLKKALEIVKLFHYNNNNNNICKNTNMLNVLANTDLLPLCESNMLNIIKYRSINGIRIEAGGRLTKRLTASRSIFKYKYKGSIKNKDSSVKNISCLMLRGNYNSNIQFTIFNSKTRNGSFGVKG